MLSVLLFRIYTVIGASLVLLFNDYLGLIGKYQWWGLQIIGVRSILLHIIHLPTFTYLESYLPSVVSLLLSPPAQIPSAPPIVGFPSQACWRPTYCDPYPRTLSQL